MSFIIAIDGPAASGKSTTAKFLAKKMNFLYIDTGAMYRAATFLCLEKNLDIENEEEIAEAVKNHKIALELTETGTKTLLDSQDISDKIRTREVTKNVFHIAGNAKVREHLVSLQREMSKSANVILDGRDIGTVVFPNADLKIFMVATVEERAKRRLLEFETKGEKVELSTLVEEIARRDKLDSERSESPLKKADDAIEIDTSNKTIEEQVDEIYTLFSKIKKA
jgi:cytidylate kinase